MLCKSVLGILPRDTNPYLKLIEVRNFLLSKKRKEFLVFVDWKLISIFTVPYVAQFMKRFGIRAKSLKDICYIVSEPLSSAMSFKGMNNAVKDFNYSRKLCKII